MRDAWIVVIVFLLALGLAMVALTGCAPLRWVGLVDELPALKAVPQKPPPGEGGDVDPFPAAPVVGVLILGAVATVICAMWAKPLTPVPAFAAVGLASAIVLREYIWDVVIGTLGAALLYAVFIAIRFLRQRDDLVSDKAGTAPGLKPGTAKLVDKERQKAGKSSLSSPSSPASPSPST